MDLQAFLSHPLSQAIIAIVLGVAGTWAYYIGFNFLVNRIPDRMEGETNFIKDTDDAGFSLPDALALVAGIGMLVGFFFLPWLQVSINGSVTIQQFDTATEISDVGTVTLAEDGSVQVENDPTYVGTFGLVDGEVPDDISLPLTLDYEGSETLNGLQVISERPAEVTETRVFAVLVPLAGILAVLGGLWGLRDPSARNAARYGGLLLGVVAAIYYVVFILFEFGRDGVVLGDLLPGYFIALAGTVALMGQFAMPREIDISAYDGDKLRQQTRPWVFIFPAVFVLGLYLVYPAVYTLYLSFLNRDATSFVGLENYFWAFSNPKVQEAIRNNIFWLILVPGLSTAFGLVIAVLADRVRWENVAKALIFLPMAISFVGASVIWRFIYFRDPSVGLLNAVVTSLGGQPVAWLITSPWNNLALIIVMVWIQTGFAMVLLSSALKAVPEETIEAARIDGASEVRIFFSILIPQIADTIAVVVTTILILVLKVFDIVYVMTSGEFGTEVLANRMITLLQNGDFHQSSTVAMILMIAVIPIMAVNIRRFQAEEELR